MKERIVSKEECGTCRSLHGDLVKDEVVYVCMEGETPDTCWVDTEKIKKELRNSKKDKWWTGC